ncbi:uncharacterized protein SAPINGB_P001963 [Magnusiomyces paraingens]|uniref:Uncharacterized protein n=1 Tax=Magnusiomyces paraingens TaxID=2606893 RepID=A0A5E8BCN0_9ASCO|nr:uncharacterized protein SAPINGB_P001963 [Saprochaete ingens]VVT48811.1 unnamed protein product [Saprochaete ingens]
MEAVSPLLTLKRKSIGTNENDDDSAGYNSDLESPRKNTETRTTPPSFFAHNKNSGTTNGLIGFDDVSTSNVKLLVEELPDISDTRTFKDALIKASNIPDNDGAFMYYLLSSRINSEEDSLMIAAYDNQILPKINPQKTNCVLYVPFDALLQDSSSNAFEQNLSETEWYRALTTRKSSDSGVFSMLIPIDQNDHLSVIWILLDPASQSYKIYRKDSSYIQVKNGDNKTHDLPSLFPEVLEKREKIVKSFSALTKLLREAVKDLFAMNDMLSEWEALPGYIPTSTEYRYTASILDMYDICISHIDIQSSVKTFLSEEYQNTQQLDEEALQSEKVSMLRVFSQEYGRFYKLKIRQDGTINNQSFQDDKKFYFSRNLFEEFQSVYEIFSVHFLLHEVFNSEISLHGKVNDAFLPFLNFWFPTLLEEYNKLSNHEANLWVPYFSSVYSRKIGSYNDQLPPEFEKRHTQYPPLSLLRPTNLFLPQEMLNFCQKYCTFESDDDLKTLYSPNSPYSKPSKEMIYAFREVLKKIIRGLGLDSALSPLKLQIEEPTLTLEEFIDSMHYDTLESVVRRYKRSLVMAYIQSTRNISITKPLDEGEGEEDHQSKKSIKWPKSPVLVYYSGGSVKNKRENMRFKLVLNPKELFQSIILDCQTPPIGKTAPLEPWVNDNESDSMYYNQHLLTGHVSKSLYESTYRNNSFIVKVIRTCYVKSNHNTTNNGVVITFPHLKRAKRRKVEAVDRVTRSSRAQAETTKEDEDKDKNGDEEDDIVLVDEVIEKSNSESEESSSSNNNSSIDESDNVDLHEISDTEEETVQPNEDFKSKVMGLTVSAGKSITQIGTQPATKAVTQSFTKAVTQSVAKAITKSVTRPINNSAGQPVVHSATQFPNKVAKKTIYRSPPKEPLSSSSISVKTSSQNGLQKGYNFKKESIKHKPKGRPRIKKLKEPSPPLSLPESDEEEEEEDDDDEDDDEDDEMKSIEDDGSVIVVDDFLSPQTSKRMNRNSSSSIEDLVEVE